MKKLALAAAVLALLSVTANAQVECPDGQRQGATAAARSDEGVTLRPRLYREGAGFAPALTFFRSSLPALSIVGGTLIPLPHPKCRLVRGCRHQFGCTRAMVCSFGIILHICN